MLQLRKYDLFFCRLEVTLEYNDLILDVIEYGFQNPQQYRKMWTAYPNQA